MPIIISRIFRTYEYPEYSRQIFAIIVYHYNIATVIEALLNV